MNSLDKTNFVLVKGISNSFVILSGAKNPVAFSFLKFLYSINSSALQGVPSTCSGQASSLRFSE